MGVTIGHSHFNYCMVVALDDTLVYERKSSKKVVYWTTKMNRMYLCACIEDISIFITQTMIENFEKLISIVN